MKIAVVGTGYVGLVTGTCLAETGNSVVCVDINEEKVKMMQAYKLPIYEPGLFEVVKEARGRNLFFSTDTQKHVAEGDIIFVRYPQLCHAGGDAT